MEQVKLLLLLILCVQTGEGFSWNSDTFLFPACAGSSISLAWVYIPTSGESSQLISWTKFDGAGRLINVADSFGGLTPATGYDGRLTRIGNAGIQMSNATSSDSGTYTVVVTLISGSEYRMNGTVRVHENATASCKPTCDSDLKCQIPQDCPVKSYIDAVWTVEGVKYPNVFPCSPNNYNKLYSVCAEGEAITSCYNVPSLWCEKYTCKGTQCQLVLGLALGLGLGIQCATISIDVGIFIYTRYKHAYTLGRVLGLGLGITFQVGWIIIVSLIFTDKTSNECKLELGLGLGLGSGMPYLITGIIAVIFMFFSWPIFKGILNRDEYGKGIITGILFTSVIGIIVVYLKYDKLKRESPGTKHEDNPPKPAGKSPEQELLEHTTGNNERKTKNSGTSAVHRRTQNKAETKLKQTNDRQLPVPPANTGFEETQTFRQLPQPPKNGETKDRNQRGISATIDDTSDLASETPRPMKLPPLTPKQTVEKEDVSEEPKKKRKKKKKKDQMNVETPEEENAETNPMVN